MVVHSIHKQTNKHFLNSFKCTKLNDLHLLSPDAVLPDLCCFAFLVMDAPELLLLIKEQGSQNLSCMKNE